MRRALPVVLVTGALLVALMAGPAGAASPTVQDVGWWTRSPSPPNSPAFSVGNAPDDALSVAALHIDVGNGALALKISVLETDGQGQAAAAIQACTTEDPWTAVKAGDFSKKPKQNCAKPVDLARGGDGKWTGDLLPLVEGTENVVSVMLVPKGATGPVPVGGTWQIGFAAPVLEGQTVATTTTTRSSSSSGTTYSSSGGSTSGSGTATTRATSSGAATTGATAARPATTSAGAAPRPVSAPATSAAAAAPPTTAAAAPAATQAGAATPSTVAAGYQGLPVRNPSEAKAGVSKIKLLVWLLVAIILGLLAAGIKWASDNGRLSLSALTRLRRRTA